MNAWVLVDLLYYGFETNVSQSNNLLALLNALVTKIGMGVICAAMANRKPLVKLMEEN